MAIIYEDFAEVLPMVQQYDKYMSGLCPFHSDSHPSLLVFKDGWFRCLTCEAAGRWITLWNRLHGQPVMVVPEHNVSWGTPRIGQAGLENIFYQSHDDLLHFPTLGWYLEMRGVEGRIEVNELGYYKGWYTIPVYNDKGVFITGVMRSSPPVQDAVGTRYWCPHHPVMYVPDWTLVNSSRYVVVVFGMIDALALADIRQPVVTSTGGKKSFDPAWLDSWRKPIYILPDKGEEKEAMKLARQLGWRGQVRYPPYPDGKKDVAGFLEADKRQDLISYFAEYK